MWFLGAGASAGAGIQTAWNMIWDFKTKLYCAENGVPLSICRNIGDPRLQAKLQSYFDAKESYPVQGDADEYAFYFERIHPDPDDRRRYIGRLVQGKVPSHGHRALAGLIRMDAIRVVWTTNFDRMVEDAVYPMVQSSGDLTISSLESASRAVDALNEGRWPLLCKLHGDFQSSRLKNIHEELRHQEIDHQYALEDACRRFGLAVVGYSGRDDSVMTVLERVAADGRGFPRGLFWFKRPQDTLFDRVDDLIAQASENEIDAHVVECHSFDELMPDILRFVEDVPRDVYAYVNKEPRWKSPAQVPPISSGKWPVLRFNALLVPSWPRTCRLVKCDIGGVADVRKAVEKADAAVIATRRRFGVLAFGSDTEIRRTFGPYGISGYDLHSLQESRLEHDSLELGLLYDALAHAISRECPVRVEGTSNFVVVADASQATDPLYRPLKAAARKLTGTVSGTHVRWSEAVRSRIEWQRGRLWLLIEPMIWFDQAEGEVVPQAARDFERERIATRYNRAWNSIVEAWAHMLTGGERTREVCCFGIADGADAVFEISRDTAFSWRGKDDG